MNVKELQNNMLAIAQVLEKVEVRGYDNLKNLSVCINELVRMANSKELAELAEQTKAE